MLSVLLFYLAPLPILIAALGWSHLTALVASVVASAAVASLFGPYFFAAFLIGIGLPAWWFGYLALLARSDSAGGLEWYPVGHLVFWVAVVSAAIVAIGMLMLGTSEESFRATLRKGIERALHANDTAVNAGPGRQLDLLVDIMVMAMPMAASVVTTMTNLINLVLAARIVKMSGRLRRPWPELSALRLPIYAVAVTGAAVIGSFLGGMAGLVSSTLMASMLLAYAVLGFAVLHSITRGYGARPFILGGTYTLVIVLFWPAIAMSMLGLADTAFDFRGRAGARRGSSPPRT
jgi:hypothetical protein